MHDNGTATDARVIADENLADDDGACANRYVLAQGWMPFYMRKAVSAERDALIDRAAVADLAVPPITTPMP